MKTYYSLVRWMAGAVAALRPLAMAVPVTIRWNEHTGRRRLYGKAIHGGPVGTVQAVLRTIVALFTPTRVAVVVLLLLTLAVVPDMTAEVLVADAALVTLDSRKDRLKVILDELDETQKKWSGKAMPQKDGDQLDSLFGEAKGIQDELDLIGERDEKHDEVKRWAGGIRQPTLPQAEPTVRPVMGLIAGYMTLGDYVINSKQVADFIRAGAPKGQHATVEIGTGIFGAIRYDGKYWVPVTHEESKAFHEAWETKAVPVIGTGVVEATRLPGITQLQRDEALVLRPLFASSTTNSDQVEYVRRDVATRAAAETVPGSVKPESAVEFELLTSPVRTIAAHMPVQNQQLADWGQLRGEIDNFLLYDLAKRLEEQLIYGLGTGVLLEGLTVVSGTTDISANGRYVASIHTFIDVVRMGITDVTVASYQPTAVAIHPFDWETIELEKGTDNRYVWVVVTDANGTRLWGMQVTVAQAMEATLGSATEARNLIVGDFQRGASIVDRMQSTISVGLIDDQFVRNMRTILGEERLAFPIRAPAGFAIFETQPDVP